MTHYCQDCPAFGPFCDGSAEDPSRCRELEGWVEMLEGIGNIWSMVQVKPVNNDGA